MEQGKQWILAEVNDGEIADDGAGTIDVEMSTSGRFIAEAISVRYPANTDKSLVEMFLNGDESLTSGMLHISQLGRSGAGDTGRDERPFRFELRAGSYLRFRIAKASGTIPAESLNVAIFGRLVPDV